ncbi:MAG: ComEC/Rec2 family competence protein [Prevotella sp.]|nr:ComEC/Rec2 family competence protein [Prevotella sp.]
MAIGIIAAPMIPIVRIVMLAFVACILLTWLLRRWDFVQSIGVLLCFFWMGMLVGQNVERPYRYQRKVELPTEKRSFSRMERVQQRCLDYRRTLLDRYRTSSADDEYAVLAAMTLGDKSALTKELRETYSKTGASHILALSGLHLGIIYLLLFRLTLGRRRFWLSQVAIILSIWAFAFLTGLSTSVVRSATMISIYALFSVGGRHRSPVNILCFTAIVMLLVNPASLFDIGFQLSFSAVLAILLLMPLFESFFPEHYFEGRPLQHYIYNMVGLSVAAQVGVAPLIAFYFGRFSTYFLLTNFIVIPAATMILYGALLVVMIPSLAPVLLGFVGILNKALGWVSQMPCASIDGLHPSVLQICLLYVVFFCVYFSLRILQRVPPIT